MLFSTGVLRVIGTVVSICRLAFGCGDKFFRKEFMRTQEIITMVKSKFSRQSQLFALIISSLMIK